MLVVVTVNTSDGAPPLIDSSVANEAANVFVGNMALNGGRGMQFGASLSETDLEEKLFEIDAETGMARKKKADDRQREAVESAKAEQEKQEGAKKTKLSRVKAPGCYDLFIKRLLVWC